MRLQGVMREGGERRGGERRAGRAGSVGLQISQAFTLRKWEPWRVVGREGTGS